MPLLLSLLLPPAWAATCPAPTPPIVGGVVSADGAVNVLVSDDAETCWWIVDDLGDSRVGARWDRSRRYPVQLGVLGDGRAIVVIHDPDRWALAVRDEHGSERHLAWLPGPPSQMLVHPTLPLVALVWDGHPEARVWLVDVTRGFVEADVRVPPEHAARLAFSPDAPALLVDGGWLAISGGVDDAPR